MTRYCGQPVDERDHKDPVRTCMERVPCPTHYECPRGNNRDTCVCVDCMAHRREKLIAYATERDARR